MGIRYLLKIKKGTDEQGFTIIELLIATLVFSVILVILIFGVLSITNSYYKGYYQTLTQNASRNIITNIAESIEFSSNDSVFEIQPSVMTADVGALCIGNQRYTFILGQQFVSILLQTDGLRLALDSPCPTSPSFIPKVGDPTAANLLPGQMRIASLSLTQVGSTSNLYKVEVRVVYGADDLLCSPSEFTDDGVVGADCSSSTPMPSGFNYYAQPDLQCKQQAGSQFCSVSDLTTYAQERVQ